jgi:anti-sigma regulatory factor (Ser/Thr protein kinase)
MPDPSENPLLPLSVVAERSHIVIPSLPNWIEPTVEYLRQKAVLGGACQETRSGKLLVALHEAITNAIVHGNLGVSSELKEQGNSVFAEALAQRASDPALANRTVDIVVDLNGDVCQWLITDQGNGFDVERVLARCMSDDPEVLLASGRGILMMKSFLDDVRFDLGGRRAILSLARNSGAEKRRETRVPLHAPFQVTPLLSDGTPQWASTYEAVSRNFSEHGISILQQHLSVSGQVLIGVPTERGLVQIPAEVKHSRALGSSGMELGCQFADPLAPEPPLAIMPAPTPPQLEEVQRAVTSILENYQTTHLPGHERRAHPRVVFNERVMIASARYPTPIVGYARDLSKGGISLIGQQPIGGEMTITLSPPAEPQPLKVRCKVVRCSLIQEGFYDIGAAFLRLEDRTGSG